LIATPPHPDYIAGHPSFSQAAAVLLANLFGTNDLSFTSTSTAYCNTGTPGFDSQGLVISCTQNGKTWYVGDPADCAAIIGGVITNDSPLICPITETFASFTDASIGPDGSSDSRVWGGIHTASAVNDAVAVGDAIGQAVAENAGLLVSEPSPLVMLFALPTLYSLRLRKRA